MAVQWVNSVFWIDGEPVIPADRLDDCLKRAFRDKTNDFAVNGYDLKNAWSKISAEEDAAETVAKADEQKANAIRNCTQRHMHVGDKDDGLAEYLLGGMGGVEITVPCLVCRPDAHAIRVVEVKARLKKSIEPVDETLRKMQENPHKYAVDPFWLLAELQQAAGRKSREMKIPEHADFWREIYLKLVSASDYLKLNP